MTKVSSYWIECIEMSFEEAQIQATPEQAKAVAYDVDRAHEMHAEYHGYLNIPNPLLEEIKKLKEALKEERSLVFCRVCKGQGSITENAPGINRSCTSTCWKCNGLGKHKP